MYAYVYILNVYIQLCVYIQYFIPSCVLSQGEKTKVYIITLKYEKFGLLSASRPAVEEAWCKGFIISSSK